MIGFSYLCWGGGSTTTIVVEPPLLSIYLRPYMLDHSVYMLDHNAFMSDHSACILDYMLSGKKYPYGYINETANWELCRSRKVEILRFGFNEGLIR